MDKKKAIEKLKKEDPKAYQITQEGGTEAPFTNEYNNNKREGIYVDAITGRPLFSSTHKYDSGSGWPSFYDVIDPKNVDTKKDYKLILPRTEIHSVDDTHLGHVFKDGPEDKTGLRYCINSKSLKFIPKEEMKDPKYEGQYDPYFDQFFAEKKDPDKTTAKDKTQPTT
ncbi:MAG: peptide-methionine (R)-S-oxide reductase MsrB [Bdellovibrionota bacterium]